MKKQHWKGGALIAPVPPTIVTCGNAVKSNALTVAWTGIINTIPPKTYISVRPERFSYSIIKETGEFVINLPTEKLVRAVDYIGCRTGAKEDKIQKTGLTLSPCTRVKAPQIEQCPITLECRVERIVPLGSHDMFIAGIVGVNVSEELLDEKGRLDMSKAHLLAYAHGEYFALGKKLGSFGYSVKKKKKLRQNRANSHKIQQKDKYTP